MEKDNDMGQKKDILLGIGIPVIAFFSTFLLHPYGLNGNSLNGNSLNGWNLAENASCLTCHKDIVENTISKKPELANLHRRHLESKRMEYDGKQQLCTTCHEAWKEIEDERGEHTLIQGGVVHPETSLPACRKLIRRPAQGPVLFANMSFHNTDPYIFKPALRNLQCVTCHGPDSKLGIIFYGRGSESWRKEKQ
jgi:cytochrome c553